MKIFALALLAAIIGCIEFIVLHHQDSDRESFLRDNPWSWMPDVNLGFATPILSPRNTLHPSINQWAFRLDYPAGFAEYEVVDQVCIYGSSADRVCEPYTAGWISRGPK